MDSALHTDSSPARAASALNRSATVVTVLAALGALGSAAVFLTPLGNALGEILSWAIFLVFALCEFVWSAGAALGVLLGAIGLFRPATRTGAVIPAVICLLLLIGYGYFAASGPSLFFS